MGYFIFFIVLFFIWKSRISSKAKVYLASILVSFFAAFRYNIGFDYLQYYNNIQSGWYSVEPLSMLLQSLANYIHPVFYFMITSFLMYPLMLKSITKDSANVMESILFFICFQSFFICSLSTVRQAMSWAVIWWIISKHGNVKFITIIGSLIAFCFHSSGLVGLVLLLPWYKLKRVHLILLFCLSWIGSYIIIYIVSHIQLDNIFFYKFQEYLEEDYGGATKIKYLIWSIYISIIICYDKLVKSNVKYQYYIAISTIGICLYNATLMNAHLADRLLSTFWGPVICLIPQLRRYIGLKRPIYIVICLVLFSYSIYISHNSSLDRGDNPSCYYPYRTIFNIDFKY